MASPWNDPLPFSPSLVTKDAGPLIRLHVSPTGKPIGAWGAISISRPLDEAWKTIAEVQHLWDRVPMVHRVDVGTDRLRMQLRFKIALFAVTFGFEVAIHWIGDHSLELTYLSGEPRDMHLRFDMVSGASAEETILYVRGSFDVDSVGFLAKYFLKHHPEIRSGIFPGVVVSIMEAIKGGM